jgi:hypothetical protein
MKTENQIQFVINFQELISTSFQGDVNAICWNRNLIGDFSEIVEKIAFKDTIIELKPEDLQKLQLSKQGQLARKILLNDLKLLKTYGAAPVLNIIKNYDRDDSFPFFPTDVYSYHVDKSPIATDTYLCTYSGEASDILPNEQATKKTLIPEIRKELKTLYDGHDAGFEAFLSEHFFDLHYQPKQHAKPINLGIGNLWKLATENPKSLVPPCIHRAPIEKNGETRLMIIC